MMNEKERKDYFEFMFNMDNEYKCDHCPENREFDNWEGKLPCGQQNCWVTCHCESLNDDDDEY